MQVGWRIRDIWSMGGGDVINDICSNGVQWEISIHTVVVDETCCGSVREGGPIQVPFATSCLVCSAAVLTALPSGWHRLGGGGVCIIMMHAWVSRFTSRIWCGRLWKKWAPNPMPPI